MNRFSLRYYGLLIIVFALLIFQTSKSNNSDFPSYALGPEKPKYSLTNHSTKYRKGYSEHYVCVSCPAAHNHASSIIELNSGNLLAVWFGGEREGAKDVSIYQSKYDLIEGKWSPAKAIIDRRAATNQVARYIKKLGNPVVVNNGNNIWIFFVSVGMGGWSGSSINFSRSNDQGRTWSQAQRLVTSPFFNVSTLVRTNPLVLSHGLIGLPAYHEFVGKFGEYLLISPSGQLLDKNRISWGTTSLQPSIVALNKDNFVAFMRNTARRPRKVFSAASKDSGKTWGDRKYIPLPNPDASIAAIMDNKGRLLMALNNSEYSRRDMSLAVSSDNGANWKIVHRFDYLEKKGAEFSYPSLIQAKNGNYHLVYTWHRKRIKHVSFNLAWLEERIAKAKIAK